MNEAQLDALKSYHPSSKPRMGPLDDTTRTLLYGYDAYNADLSTQTFHVFQHEGKLHQVRYKPVAFDKGKVVEATAVSHQVGDTLPVEDMVPTKRLYPEMCDFEFCKMLIEKGMTLPFTNFNHERRLETTEGLAGFADIPELDQPSQSLGMQI